MSTELIRLLFLCTENSCRSIMAEAITNHYGHNRYRTFSAGCFPTGTVHPKAIETLKRHGIAPGKPRSKSWDEFKSQSIDLVITVCDQVASESCPVFHGHPQSWHWSIPDPAKVNGTDEEIIKAFEALFYRLKLRIEKELLS